MNQRSSSLRTKVQPQKEYPRSWLENESLAAVSSPYGRGSVIRTKVASVHDKEVFLDRLEKEVLQFFNPKTQTKKKGQGPQTYATMKRQIQTQLEEKAKSKAKGKIVPKKDVGPTWKHRMVVGTNQCTRILERLLRASCNKDIGSDNQQDGPIIIPSLIVLARDMYPPTMLSHVPVMVHQWKQQQSPNNSRDIPILLLPGRASHELGKAMGTKRVSILIFLPPNNSNDTTKMEEKGDAVPAIQKQEDQQMQDRITSFVEFVNKSLV